MFKTYERVITKVKAVQFTYKNRDQVLNSLTGQFTADFENDMPVIKVKTIHGDVAIVRIGDWIVMEAVPGFYYPVKDDVFRNCYV